MKYSKSILLYQDKPTYGFILRLVLMIVPVGLLGGSIYLFLSGKNTDAIVLLAEAFIVGSIFWFILPRRYQVYEDHLRIVLGGPMSVKIGFNQIEAIEIASRFTLSVNYVTRFTRNFVEINRKRGMNIAITPGDNDLFVENANVALNQWMNQDESKSLQ